MTHADIPAAVTPPPFTTVADIVATLTAERRAQDVGQRELADFMRVTQSTLALWETLRADRRRVPTAPLLLAWANALGYDLRLVAVDSAGDCGSEDYRRGWDDCAHAVNAAATRPDMTGGPA